MHQEPAGNAGNAPPTTTDFFRMSTAEVIGTTGLPSAPAVRHHCLPRGLTAQEGPPDPEPHAPKPFPSRRSQVGGGNGEGSWGGGAEPGTGWRAQGSAQGMRVRRALSPELYVWIPMTWGERCVHGGERCTPGYQSSPSPGWGLGFTSCLFCQAASWPQHPLSLELSRSQPQA